MTNYLMTFEAQVEKLDLQVLKQPGLSFQALLINDQYQRVDRPVQVRGSSAGLTLEPIKMYLNKSGIEKFSMILISNYGDVAKSNQTTFRVI